MHEQIDSVKRLTRDLAKAAATLSDDEARFLVDAYYTMQENRIRTAAQAREMDKSHEPHEVLNWLFAQDSTLESQISRALLSYAESRPVGQWSMSIYGIGPIIAAGLLAHIDIEKAPTVGHIWRFAGLDPTLRWEKKTKRPWNADLKTLCWKIGQSFMKFSSREDCYYGKVYRDRKAIEIENNEGGKFAEQAALALERKKFRDDTKAKGIYESGKLPPAHIDARARRYAVKLFLAHWHEVAYVAKFGQKPPLPYAIAVLGHAHIIPPQ